MADWVRLCGAADAPAEGNVMEAEASGVAVCLARIGGELAALDNWCPHRRGPLGQGWVEDGAVICPWHSWAFDCKPATSCHQTRDMSRSSRCASKAMTFL